MWGLDMWVRSEITREMGGDCFIIKMVVPMMGSGRTIECIIGVLYLIVKVIFCIRVDGIWTTSMEKEESSTTSLYLYRLPLIITT